MKTKIILSLLCFGCLSAAGLGLAAAEKTGSVSTIQVTSYAKSDLAKGKTAAQQLEQKGFADVRLEQIENLYILRVGKYTTPAQGQTTLSAVRKLFPGSFLRDAYYVETRIVYPTRTAVTAKPPVAPAAPITPSAPVAQRNSVPAHETAVVPPASVRPAPARSGGIPYPVILAFAAFIALLILPFIPGFREIRKKRDADPLPVKMNYAKDPRFFEQSFKQMLEQGLQTAGRTPGMKQIKLSKPETVEVCDTKTVKAGEAVAHIVYVKGAFVSQKGARIPAEVYAKGPVNLGEDTMIRALAGDADITLGARTKIIRWIGTDGSIHIGEQCVLGVSCACGGGLDLARGCTFRALFGGPITTYQAAPTERRPAPDTSAGAIPTPTAPDREVRNISDLAWYATATSLSVPTNARVESDIIGRRDIRIGKGAVVTGSVKAYGNVWLDEGVTVNGNIFAEGDIHTGPRCTIAGDVFCQRELRLASGTRVGRSGGVKSVIGKRCVRLEGSVAVFGYVLTEGSGTVL